MTPTSRVEVQSVERRSNSRPRGRRPRRNPSNNRIQSRVFCHVTQFNLEVIFGQFLINKSRTFTDQQVQCKQKGQLYLRPICSIHKSRSFHDWSWFFSLSMRRLNLARFFSFGSPHGTSLNTFSIFKKSFPISWIYLVRSWERIYSLINCLFNYLKLSGGINPGFGSI